MRSPKFICTSLLGLLLAASAQAKNVVYDLNNINSFQGNVSYDRLSFYGATSAIVNVTKTLGQPDPVITSLTVNFPNAAKLTATNFKKMPDGSYRSIVQGAWIYKEIFVDIATSPNLELDSPIRIKVSVSERTAFINPLADAQGATLFEVMGQIHDATPTRTVDTINTAMSGKKVTLSLRDRMGFDDKRTFGFIVNTLWYGQGTKNIAISWASPQEIDNFEAIGIVLDSTVAAEPRVAIKFRDQNGYESMTPSMPVSALLDNGFGTHTLP